MVLNVPFGKHPLVGGGGNPSCIMVSTARVHFIHDLGENTRPFIWFHLLYHRYKFINNLL